MTAARAALAAAALVAAGCSDLGGYAGSWSGRVVAEPALLLGLASNATATLAIERADRAGIAGTLTVAAEVAPLRPLAHAGNDALGALELPDAPLRSYLAAVSLAGGDAIAVVSLYPDERVDLRLLRGDALYAVFHLAR